MYASRRKTISYLGSFCDFWVSPTPTNLRDRLENDFVIFICWFHYLREWTTSICNIIRSHKLNCDHCIVLCFPSTTIIPLGYTMYVSHMKYFNVFGLENSVCETFKIHDSIHSNLSYSVLSINEVIVLKSNLRFVFANLLHFGKLFCIDQNLMTFS